MSKQTSKPWWREPWPWLLMAGPMLAIVACAITIALAVTHFRGQAIVDDGGVRRGLVIEKTSVQTQTPAPAPAVEPQP